MLGIILVVLCAISFIVVIREYNKLEKRWIVICHSLIMSSQSSLEEVETEIKRFRRLESTVHDIYYLAHWIPDREYDVEKLWQNLRDAALFEPKRR